MNLLNEALFERAIQWVAERAGEAQVLAARQAFELSTGAMDAGDADHESRMLHFFEWWLCTPRAGAATWVAEFAAAHALSEAELRQLAGWQRSHRSLFEFIGFEPDGGVLRDQLLGGRFRFWPSIRDRELTLGDRFDARLIPGDGCLWLSPGRVYHLRKSFEAMDRLLREPECQRLSLTERLDGLLRMRSRLVRFASIRPEHVFCLDGFASTAFAAPWADPAHRGNHT